MIPASFNSLIASSLAFFSNHSSIVIPGFESSCDFNNWSFNALTPSIVFAFLIWFKNKSEVTPASCNSLIAFSFAYSNSAASRYSFSLFLSSSAPFANSLSASHLFKVSSVFESLCDFNNWSFNALTLSTVFAFLIWFKNKSDVTPASCNSFIASSFAFLRFHSSIVTFGFESSCDFNNSAFKAFTLSIVFALLIWFKNNSDVTPAAFNSLIAFSFAYSNSAASWYSFSLFLSFSASLLASSFAIASFAASSHGSPGNTFPSASV